MAYGGSTTMDNGEVLLQEFMVKRSQNKSILTTVNYKSRWIVLHPDVLRYCDGSLHVGVGKEKGRVNLNSVIAVEEVDDSVLKPNTFQIMYQDITGRLILYIVATTPEKRAEWIQALRSACEKCNVNWEEMYHPGVWMNGHFTCCGQRDKQAPGCRPGFKVTSENGAGDFNTANGGLRPHPMNNTRHQYVSQESGASIPPIPPPPVPPTPPKKEEKSNYTVIALYDFEKADDGDLSLTRGEELEILDVSKNNWWYAKNRRGESGYIPANYIQKISSSGLERYDWYYQGVTRAEAEGMLREDGNEGCFMVRDSSKKGQFTLSVYTKEVDAKRDVLHYHIHSEGNQNYIAQKHSFDSVPEMIKYHRLNSAGLVVRLRDPPSDRNRDQPATAGFGHDMWEINPNELVIGGLLGKGQFGEVKKARWKGRQDVAVKTMQQGAMSEQDFIGEAKTMMELQHKNLVQLYGVSTQHRPIYIVCEYMRHGSLLSYLKRHKHQLLRQPDKLLSMSVQVSAGMEFLESQGYIHRDLAARNCLVGEKNVVKVADFGLARFVIDDQYTSSLGAKFPIKWAPPEVLGYSKFSSKSDVWSFGILMWEVFTGGEMPYGPKKNHQVVEDVTHGYRLPKPPHCPESIYTIMRYCWENEADERPSFVTLRRELEKIQEAGDYIDQ